MKRFDVNLVDIEQVINKAYPRNYLSYLFCLHYYCYFLRCCHFPQKHCFLFYYHLLFFFHLYPACLVAASSSSWPSDSETRPEQPVRLTQSPFPMLPVPRNQISNITRPRRLKTLVKNLLLFKQGINFYLSAWLRTDIKRCLELSPLCRRQNCSWSFWTPSTITLSPSAFHNKIVGYTF